MMNDRARPDSVRPDEPACRQAGRDRKEAGASDAQCSIRASHVAALPSPSPALSLSKGPRLFLLRGLKGLALSDNSIALTQGMAGHAWVAPNAPLYLACQSTRRAAYLSKRVVTHAGLDPAGNPHTQIVFRRTKCLDCGQHRVDRTYEYVPG